MGARFDSLLEAVAAAGRSIQLAPGTLLIEEGESGDAVYVLVSGSLLVSRSMDGSPVTLASLEAPGTVVGEMSAMGGGIRGATVTASGPTEVLEVRQADFERLLGEYPHLASEVAEEAKRRAERGELAELLARHFGVSDDSVILEACDRARWRRLEPGEVLFREGDPADAAYFVLRGRLVASHWDSLDETDVVLGEIERGEVAGEMALLDKSTRNATVTALRRSVLAVLDESAFLDLVDRHPRLMIYMGRQMMSRARSPVGSSRASLTLAMLVSGRWDSKGISRDLEQALGTMGNVLLLSADRVDSLLSTEGAARAQPGTVSDTRVAKLLHEAELDVDFLLLEIGPDPDPWLQRCLDMADRLVIVIPDDPTELERHPVERLLVHCPPELRRILVLVHRADAERPEGTAAHMDQMDASGVVHIRSNSPEDLARLARVITGRGTGLVLGGGGARGFAHIGVFRALTELGFPVDVVGGTSIGSSLGIAIADGMSPEEMVEGMVERFANVLDYTIPLVALVKGGRIARSILKAFGDRDIEDLWRTFFCISTDITTSRIRVHTRGNLVHAVRASTSIPGVMPPVPSGESLLVDGGVLNNLPVDIIREMAPRGSVIAVDVAPVRGPGAKHNYGLSVSGWSALRSRLARRRSYPRITAVLMRSMIVASQRERDLQVARGLADLYLDLDLRGVSMFDFDQVATVAQRGYEAAMPALEAWLGARDQIP